MVWLEDFQKYVLELQKSRPNLILFLQGNGSSIPVLREGNHCSLRSGQGHEYQLARGKYYNQ